MWDGPHAEVLYSELPGFTVSLREQEGIAARVLEFAILQPPGQLEGDASTMPSLQAQRRAGKAAQAHGGMVGIL
jgi:hypothetical protein